MTTIQIDRRRDHARYRQIAADLRSMIADGTLMPGDALPSEQDLMDRYGVARQTCRRAVELLRSDGLVRTVRGSGSFVRRTGTDVEVPVLVRIGHGDGGHRIAGRLIVNANVARVLCMPTTRVMASYDARSGVPQLTALAVCVEAV